MSYVLEIQGISLIKPFMYAVKIFSLEKNNIIVPVDQSFLLNWKLRFAFFLNPFLCTPHEIIGTRKSGSTLYINKLLWNSYSLLNNSVWCKSYWFILSNKIQSSYLYRVHVIGHVWCFFYKKGDCITFWKEKKIWKPMTKIVLHFFFN